MDDVTFIIVDQDGPSDDFIGVATSLAEAKLKALVTGRYAKVFEFRTGDSMLLVGKPFHWQNAVSGLWDHDPSYGS